MIAICDPSLDGKRLAFVLVEDRLGHYPEFRAFFVRTFELDRVGLARPGYEQSMRWSSSDAAAKLSRPVWKYTPWFQRWSRSMKRWSTATYGRSCVG
jgi:hypothetical protein